MPLFEIQVIWDYLPRVTALYHLQVTLRAADPRDTLSNNSQSKGFQVAVLPGNEVVEVTRGVYVPESTGTLTAVRECTQGCSQNHVTHGKMWPGAGDVLGDDC